jgi:hypothetical protein
VQVEPELVSVGTWVELVFMWFPLDWLRWWGLAAPQRRVSGLASWWR